MYTIRRENGTVILECFEINIYGSIKWKPQKISASHYSGMDISHPHFLGSSAKRKKTKNVSILTEKWAKHSRKWVYYGYTPYRHTDESAIISPITGQFTTPPHTKVSKRKYKYKAAHIYNKLSARPGVCSKRSGLGGGGGGSHTSSIPIDQSDDEWALNYHRVWIVYNIFLFFSYLPSSSSSSFYL